MRSHRGLVPVCAVGALSAALTLTACGPLGLTGTTITERHVPELEHAVTVPVVRVVDGDTIEVQMPTRLDVQMPNAQLPASPTPDAHGVDRVRVLGIDTPETVKPDTPVQCGGPEASAFAHHAMDGQNVTLAPDPTQDDRDRYGRALRYVTLPDGTDYGLSALRAGVAKEYTYKHHPVQRFAQYDAAQTAARDERLGVWGSCPQ